MIHGDGGKIVDGSGKVITLRGVFLDNWLFWTGSSWGGGLISETIILDRLKEILGSEETERFRQRVYGTFCDKEDFARIKRLGFNSVRIPFNHRLLEDDSEPFKYSEQGFLHVDRALDLCEEYGLYAILDLHSAPGGQSSVFVADPGTTLLWGHKKNRERTVALWKAIAKRYGNRKIVAGYDLLNEPGDCKPKHLVALYREIIAAIREVDPYHMVLLEGLTLSTDFSMFKSPLDPNQAYAFHTYWLYPFSLFAKDEKKDQVIKLVKLSRDHNCPILNTEFGAGTDKWTGDCVELFEEPASNVSGWIFWPWKRPPEFGDKYRHLGGIKSPESWKRLMKWIGLPLWGKPSKKEALMAIDEFFKANKGEQIEIDQQILNALLPKKVVQPSVKRK
jgi:hypothetical protein